MNGAGASTSRIVAANRMLPIPLKGNYRGIGYREEKGHGCQRGIQESEDMEEKVGMIMKELGFSKQYTVHW